MSKDDIPEYLKNNQPTPGPWKWTLQEENGQFQLEGNIEYADCNPVIVAYDCGCGVDKQEHGFPRCPLSPRKADMQLIAKAPDMQQQQGSQCFARHCGAVPYLHESTLTRGFFIQTLV